MENEDLGKIVFKCKHCENDDLRHMQFASLNKQSPQYANHMYKNNWDYETTPKIPVGIHIRCAKCGKDTFIMPDSFSGTEWGNDIPEQCIVPIKFEKPQFSAIQYVMNDEGFLDKVVLTANNQKISLITQELIDDKVGLSVIGKKQYDLLLSRGLPEVGANKAKEVEVVAQQDKPFIKENNNKENNKNK